MPIKNISIKGPQLFIVKCSYSKFCILIFQYFNLSVVKQCPILRFIIVACVFVSEYHFTNRETMQKSIDAGDFIESAVYNQNLYGTRWARSYRHCIYSIKGPTSNNHPTYRKEKLISAEPLLLPTRKKNWSYWQRDWNRLLQKRDLPKDPVSKLSMSMVWNIFTFCCNIKLP